MIEPYAHAFNLAIVVHMQLNETLIGAADFHCNKNGNHFEKSHFIE